MKEWFIQNFDAASIVAIITALATLAGSVVSVIVALKSRSYVENARKSGHWTKCPHCKKTIYLRDLAFHMADGSLDNDLDGKAD